MFSLLHGTLLQLHCSIDSERGSGRPATGGGGGATPQGCRCHWAMAVHLPHRG